MENHILILTGPPGAGKTTLARRITETATVPSVHLHSDDFWGYIQSGRIDPWLPEATEQNHVVLSAVAQVANQFAAGGYQVVLDGIIGPWSIHLFKWITHPIHYIILMPDVDEAVHRCSQRPADTLTAPGPIRDLHRQFNTQTELSNHILNIQGKTIEEGCSLIRETLSKGTYRLEFS